MERTKTVTYQSCDWCDSTEEAKGQCDVCGKHLCENHCRNFPWGDQLYQFCPADFNVVREAIEKTGIPIAFVVSKVKGERMTGYMQDLWDARGYGQNWAAYLGAQRK